MKKTALSLIVILGLSSTVFAQRNGPPTQFPGNGGNNGSMSCRADLLNKAGRIISSYTGNNCQQSLRQCENDLQRRQSRGQNPQAYCRATNNGNNGGGNYPPNQGSGEYGPARTQRWQDFGTTKIEKIFGETVTVRVNSLLVNEILLRATSSDIRIQRVEVTLSNGQIYNLPYQAGTLNENREVRLRLNSSYSVRVSRIEIEATSSGLLGSRGRLQVLLGLAN